MPDKIGNTDGKGLKHESATVRRVDGPYAEEVLASPGHPPTMPGPSTRPLAGGNTERRSERSSSRRAGRKYGF
jgi:hypothetical protein